MASECSVDIKVVWKRPLMATNAQMEMLMMEKVKAMMQTIHCGNLVKYEQTDLGFKFEFEADVSVR